MLRIIKTKLIISSLLLLFAVSTSAFAAETKTEDEKNQDKTSVIIIQSMTGSDNTKKVIGTSDDSSLNQEIKMDFSDNYAISKNAIQKLLIPAIWFFLFINITHKIILLKKGHDVDFARYSASFIIAVVILYPFPLKYFERESYSGIKFHISIAEQVFFKKLHETSQLSSDTMAEVEKERLLSFPEIYIPQYEKYTQDFEVAISYFNSVNTLGYKKDIVFNVIEYNGMLKAQSQVGKHVATIMIPLDDNCAKVSSEFGFGDCKQKQIEWQKKYLTQALQLAQSTSLNFVDQYERGDVFTNNFDMAMSCDGIEKIDITDYSQEDMEGAYLKKAASCASRIYLEGLHKFKNITSDDYLNNSNFLKSRRLVLCNHDDTGTFKQNAYTRSVMKEKVAACVQEACGADGSPYFCSAATTFYQALQTERPSEWRLIPAFIYGDMFTNVSANAEVFGSKFSFESEEFENDQTVNKNPNSLFSMSFPSTSGKSKLDSSLMSSMTEWFSDKWQYIFGIDFDLSYDQLSFLGYLGEDGFWGTKRLGVCLANPSRYIDGWNCGNLLSETYFNGVRNMKSAISTAITSYASLGKIKGTMKTTGAENRQLLKVLSSATSIGNLSIIGAITGLASNTNVYDETTLNVSTSVAGSALALAVAYGPPALGEMLRTYAAIQFGFGFTIAVLIPLIIIYRFLSTLITWFMQVITALQTMEINLPEAAGSNGSTHNPYAKQEFDIPDWAMYLFLGVLYPVTAVIGAIFCIMYLDVFFRALGVNIFEIATIISMNFTADNSNSNFWINILDTIIGYFLIITIIRAIIGSMLTLGDYAAWLLFSNGSYKNEDSSENAHNEIQSRIK